MIGGIESLTMREWRSLTLQVIRGFAHHSQEEELPTVSGGVSHYQLLENRSLTLSSEKLITAI